MDIDGWGVAQADLVRSWSGRELPDHCWWFRSATTWTLVTMRRSVRYGDYDQPSAGKATISSRAVLSLEELAHEVERTYSAGAWVELLDGGYEHDADLYRAWVPERIRRDFDGASIQRKDLALYTGLWGGDPVPAPVRELKGWGDEAVEQLAAHLVELGFEVLDQRPASRTCATTGTTTPRRPTGPSLRMGDHRRRIDSVGEVFIRLEPDAVAGPLFQPVADEEGW